MELEILPKYLLSSSVVFQQHTETAKMYLRDADLPTPRRNVPNRPTNSTTFIRTWHVISVGMSIDALLGQ